MGRALIYLCKISPCFHLLICTHTNDLTVSAFFSAKVHFLKLRKTAWLLRLKHFSAEVQFFSLSFFYIYPHIHHQKIYIGNNKKSFCTSAPLTLKTARLTHSLKKVSALVTKFLHSTVWMRVSGYAKGSSGTLVFKPMPMKKYPP